MANGPLTWPVVKYESWITVKKGQHISQIDIPCLQLENDDV